MKTQIYECPECNDRKLVEYSAKALNIKPTVWCSCEGFVIMEKVDN